jgi:hypothetical protein
MISFIFISVYLISIIFLVFILRNYIYHNKSILSPSLILLLSYFLTNHFGLIILFINQDGINKIKHIDVNTLALMSAYTLIVIFSYLLVSIVLPDKKPLKFQGISKKKYDFKPIFFLGLIGVCIIFSIENFLNGSPLQNFFMSLNVSSGLNDRINDRNNNQNYNFLTAITFEILKYYLTVFAILITWRGKFKYFFLFFISFIICLMWYSANLSKGFVAYPFMILILIQFYKQRAISFSKNNIVILFGTFIIIPFVTKFIMGHDEIIIYYPIERIMLSNLFPQYVIVNHFSDSYLFGLGLPSWFSLYGHSQIDLTELAWNLMNPSLFEKLLMSYSNPASFVSEGHANAGFFGVFISSLFAFSLIRFLKMYAIFLSKYNILFASGLELYLYIYAFNLSITHVFPKLLDLKLIVLLIICCLLSVSFSEKVNVRNNKNE